MRLRLRFVAVYSLNEQLVSRAEAAIAAGDLVAATELCAKAARMEPTFAPRPTPQSRLQRVRQAVVNAECERLYVTFEAALAVGDRAAAKAASHQVEWAWACDHLASDIRENSGVSGFVDAFDERRNAIKLGIAAFRAKIEQERATEQERARAGFVAREAEEAAAPLPIVDSPSRTTSRARGRLSASAAPWQPT